ncbi:MAG: lipopolysaccharide heptosyltransferase II [Nitrospirae bacterium]|nr:lipopolysaccharide heptosyltransferase II [Nitrospirota bacterium]
MQKIKNPRKILIVKPSSLGDVVHSLPFLNALKERFPKAEVHWVIAKRLDGLLSGHPMIDKLWIIDKDNWKVVGRAWNTLKELKEFFRNLRNERYDMVVDLQGLLRSGVITMATRAPFRIGFKEAREGSRLFYTHKVEGGRDIHAVDRYLKIAAFLGCDIRNVCFPLPLSFNSSLITHHLSLSDDYAVIIPGARWVTKRWPAERFGELASRLPMEFLVVGGRSDIDISNRVVNSSKGNAISLAGKTDIKELIEIMRSARFVVGNDSGPMHIATALKTRVFAIFGPTDPQKTGPYGRSHIVIKSNLECSPCFKKRRCKKHECMDTITVDMVMEKIKETTGMP